MRRYQRLFAAAFGNAVIVVSLSSSATLGASPLNAESQPLATFVPPRVTSPSTLLAKPNAWYDKTPGQLTPDGRGKFSMPVIRPNVASSPIPVWPGTTPGLTPYTSPYIPQVAPMEGRSTPDGRGTFFFVSDR